MSLLSFLNAVPHAEPIRDQQRVDQLYKTMRVRMMYSTIIGYAAFYIVRKNFSMAMPAFLQDLNYTKTDLGLILTVFSIIYGFGKFFNGILADRANPRYFMAIGLLGAALANILFGFSSGLIFFGIFWIFNAWFQAMGWPPCARVLTHWYSPKELGTWWGIWNSSHQIGGAFIYIVSGFLILNYGWRSAFFMPAAIAALVAVFLMLMLRDTPQSLGLPAVEVYRNEGRPDADDALSALSTKDILFKHVLRNKLIWYLSFANFFVYIVRIGVLDWAPTFLVEAKGSNLAKAGFTTAGYEVAGIVGALAAGWLSDKVFKGRRGPVNLVFMILVALIMVGFWMVPAGHPILDAVCLLFVGFLIYGPQMLISVAAADFASKKAAATSTGLTGTFGYLGSALCGAGTGIIVDTWGWDGGFIFFILSAVIACLFFIPILWLRSPVLDSLHGNTTASEPVAEMAPVTVA